MKKILLYFILLFCSAFLGNAQYYVTPWTAPGQNPGGLNEDQEDFPNAAGAGLNWVTIVTGPSTNWTNVQTIPFTFNFNGTDYTSYQVHPSGVLTFSSNPTQTPTVRENLPSANVPDNSICALGLSIANDRDFIISKTFGEAPNRQHWVQFTSATTPGTIDGYVYLSIVLEETTNKVYVVDQRILCINSGSACQGRPQLSVGLQIDSVTAIQPPYLTHYEGMAGADRTPRDNAYMEFVPGTQPNDDLAMISIEGNAIDGGIAYSLTDTPIKIKGRIRNVGSALVSNYQLNYSINGGATVSDNITQNIGPLSYVNFESPTDWNPSAPGDYTIRVWVSNPNGNTDGDPTNDEITIEVKVYEELFNKLPLYEVFSSSTCGPCRPGNANVKSILNPFQGEYAIIKYQLSGPGTGDPYAIEEGLGRASYYGVNSIPRMLINGGWDQNAGNFTAILDEEARSQKSLIKMGLNANIDVSAQKVVYHLDIKSLIDLNNVSLRIAINESVTFQNVKSNGETEFQDVLKKMVPNENGRVISLKKDEIYDLQDVYEFQGDYRLPANGQAANRINHSFEHSVENFNNLYVVAWLQDNTTLEVLQSVDSRFNYKTSVKELNESNFEVMLYPNPSNSFTNLAINSNHNQQIEVTVLNAVGAIVNSTQTYNVVSGNNVFELSTENLSSGFYFITVNDGNSVITKKLIKR